MLPTRWPSIAPRAHELGFRTSNTLPLRYRGEIVGVLDKPGGDLQAMQIMLKHRLAQDLEQGFYKPGQVVDVLEAAKALKERGSS